MRKHGVGRSSAWAVTRQAARSAARLLGWRFIGGCPFLFGRSWGGLGQRRHVADGACLVDREQTGPNLSDHELDLLVRRGRLETGENEFDPPWPLQQPRAALLETLGVGREHGAAKRPILLLHASAP